MIWIMHSTNGDVYSYARSHIVIFCTYLPWKSESMKPRKHREQKKNLIKWNRIGTKSCNSHRPSTSLLGIAQQFHMESTYIWCDVFWSSQSVKVIIYRVICNYLDSVNCVKVHKSNSKMCHQRNFVIVQFNSQIIRLIHSMQCRWRGLWTQSILYGIEPSMVPILIWIMKMGKWDFVAAIHATRFNNCMHTKSKELQFNANWWKLLLHFVSLSKSIK